MTALLEVSGLEAGYGKSQVLFGMGLAVQPGRCTTLLGRNGMGKSTTIKSVMGLLEPLRGEVRWKGQAIQGKPPYAVARLGLGFVGAELGDFAGERGDAAGELRAGRAGSGKGAASMVTEAITVARACGASGEVLVRGDSAYGNSSVVTACRRAGARFSLVLTKTAAVVAAIADINDTAWIPVCYPAAIPTPVPGSPMPKSPKPPAPLSVPRRLRSRHG